MADETTEQQGSPTSADPDDATVEPDKIPSSSDSDKDTEQNKHGTKRGLREGVAKVVGYTVEVASILGQQGGPAVEAERDIAEANTEQLIDRIDGDE